MARMKAIQSFRLRLHSSVTTHASKERSPGARFFGRAEGSSTWRFYSTAEAVPLRGFGGRVSGMGGWPGWAVVSALMRMRLSLMRIGLSGWGTGGVSGGARMGRFGGP